MLNDYGKGLFRPWCSVQNFALAAAALFIVGLAIRVYSLNSSEIASWVQAFGSIFAIWGAFTLSNKQLRAQYAQKNIEEKNKSGAFVAVILSAVERCREAARHFECKETRLEFLIFWEYGGSEIFKSSLASLKLLPAHELGGYELVVAHNNILGGMSNLLGEIEKYLKIDDPDELDLDTLELSVNGHSTLIEICWMDVESFSEFQFA